MKYFLYLFVFFAVACNTNNNQDSKPVAEQPFWNDIQAFKKQDSVSFPPKNAILFIGSSSFTKWTDVQDYFPGYTIVNRGFGGSTLLDQIRYADDIIFPYQPKQIAIYCGENDLASSDTVTATMVVDRFKQLYQIIRGRTKAPILYISDEAKPQQKTFISKNAGSQPINCPVSW
jgi:hypothetical protein